MLGTTRHKRATIQYPLRNVYVSQITTDLFHLPQFWPSSLVHELIPECNMSSGAGTSYPAGSSEFIQIFIRVRVAQT